MRLEWLKQQLHYDPVTGALTWLRGPYRGRTVRVNDPKHGRRRVTIGCNRYTATHIIFFYMTGRWPLEVDHVNNVKDDDRWENLREATRVEQQRNRRGHSLSGFKGVYPTSSGKFQAMIRDNGRTRPLGTFATPEEAHFAYCAVAQQMHGAFFNGGHSRDN